MADPTPEQRVAERVAAAWVNAYVPFNSVDATTAALNAVRAALTSDDPQVVGAMAERVGLTVDATVTIEPGGEFPHWTASPPSVRVDRRRWVTPWREVPDA